MFNGKWINVDHTDAKDWSGLAGNGLLPRMGSILDEAACKATNYLQPYPILVETLELIDGSPTVRNIARVVMVYFVAMARDGRKEVVPARLRGIFDHYRVAVDRPHVVTTAMNNAVRRVSANQYGLFPGKQARRLSDEFVRLVQLSKTAEAYAEDAHNYLNHHLACWYNNRYETATELLKKAGQALDMAVSMSCEPYVHAFVLTLQAKVRWRENNLGRALDILSEAIRLYGMHEPVSTRASTMASDLPTPGLVQYHVATAFFNRACYKTLITFHCRSKEPGRLLLTIPYDMDDILRDLKEAVSRDQSLKLSAVLDPDLTWIYSNPEFLRTVDPYMPGSSYPPPPMRWLHPAMTETSSRAGSY